MGRSMVIILFVAIFFIGSLFMFYTQYYEHAKTEFEYNRLIAAIDISCDAALETGRLLGGENMNPTLLSKTFFDVISSTYDIQDLNLLYVKTPCMVFADNDGYYVAYPSYITGSLTFRWSHKLPYKWMNGTTAWALTMNGKDVKSVTASGAYAIQQSNPVSAQAIITQTLTNAVQSTISQAALETTSFDFVVPSAQNMEGDLNSIKGPSLIVVMQGVDFGYTTKINSFTVAGAQIYAARKVAIYTIGGRNLYCYIDQNPPAGYEEIANVKLATELGYSPDLQRIGGKRP